MVLQVAGVFFVVVFFFYGYGDHRDLHSFPTRSSSDLNDADLTGVPYLTIGANITTATLGAGGVGLTLTGVELGMVLVNDTSSGFSYTAIKAKVTGATIFGISGLGITVTNLFLDINQTSDSGGRLLGALLALQGRRSALVLLCDRHMA